MDFETALKQWAPLRDILENSKRVPALEKRIAALEEKLRSPPCPRCHLPAWHVAKSEPDPVMGEVGAIRRTYRCESCGFEEHKVDV